MTSKVLKIANGQGFWGDCISAPEKLIKYGKIDYLTLDYLAEVTISIMQRQKNKDPNEQEIRDWLEGNICRCTGYQGIVAAVKAARKLKGG